MMNKEKLPIPVNVVESKDLISGFGSKELSITGVAAIIDLILIIILSSFFGNLVAILIGAMIISTVVLAIKRDKYDESIVDKFRIAYTFSKEQKQYQYQYFNMYEEDEL